MSYVGVDGCPDGWLAIEYSDNGFQRAEPFADVEAIRREHAGADLILIDVPIGLREESNKPRPCDVAARNHLGSPRSSSVFPPPVRAVLDAADYEDARRIQEEHTDGSLGAQAWGITDKIQEVDTFLRETEPDAQNVIRESHPEVCFWALNGGTATQYSKTGQPVAAFWERVRILERVYEGFCDDLRVAGTGLDSEASNDDLLDAFVLAVTASPLTNGVETLPKEPNQHDDGDPKDLPMEMVYPTFG